jgi:CRISPR system Cascade subunit CasA
MPRRLRLRPDPATEPDGGSCSLCARHQQPLVRTFLSRNHGVNYTGTWSHPLTPYRQTDEGVLPLHGSPAGLSYRNWLGLVQNDPDSHIRPARVVEALRAEEERQPTGRPYVLWAFGYDMDNMKARAWLDGRIPLLLVPAEQREALELDASRLVRSAAAGARELVAAAKQAMSGRPKELARDPADVGIRFWQETEAPFYEHLRRIGELLRMAEDTEVARRGWWRELWRTASRAFESATTVGSFEGTDPKRVAKAWNGLRRFFHGRKMQQDLLGLPLPPSRTERKGAGVPGDQ